MTEREHPISRSISARPTTFNEASRSVELVVATDADVGDGFRLSMARLPDYGPGPVPVMLDHANSTDRMAGRLDSLRLEGGQLIGRAVFADAPAADAGLALARSGIAASVKASVRPDDTRQNPDGTIQAMRWRLRHVALTPEGARALPLARDADVEQVVLPGPDHDDAVGRQTPGGLHHPGAMAGHQGVGEVAPRPGMGVDVTLHRRHGVEVLGPHRPVVEQGLRQPAHRSAAVSATLSRTYTGTSASGGSAKPSGQAAMARVAT